MSKICRVCLIEKDYNEFKTRQALKCNGCRQSKEQRLQWQREYNQKHKEHQKVIQHEYWIKKKRNKLGDIHLYSGPMTLKHQGYNPYKPRIKEYEE